MKLNEKYNQNTFTDFIDTFLPEDFQSKEEDIIIKKDRYKEITKAKILGFCESLNLHVLEMDHTHDKDPRVAIATDAFKILADHWIHRALVIFKNNDSENYRFSYLTITLDLNDKNKITKKYSNARRYSFYLGANAKVKTPEQQLIKKGKVKDIDDLLNRFSVEVVNKQFYLEVAKFFDELVSTEDHNLVLPSVSEFDLNTRKSFAVRLIGRTVFCWFLKQKKSENGQLIPDELLSSKIVADNYYHNILEPLFFGVLNASIDSRDIRSELFDKVPYLNGGLFNPQTDDYYELDRGTFASKYINTLKINDTWFKEFFELLETYNFTIDENTVFDQELSVDPEMLGKIFENLLAKKIDSETGKNEQKDTGSFYTPRQIVEYMVDQSLIEYFKTKTKIDESKLIAIVSYDLIDDTEHPLSDSEKYDLIEAIESLKILDPACGSGAYPIGALQKIVYILQQIDPDCTLWLEKKLKGVPELYRQKIINEVKQNPFDYTRKLDVIKNSIFGVDIQPVAVDVSRLRCFLTLVVESEINDTKPNRGIKPLPNLDFKFVCANTLMALPKTESTGLFDDHSGIAVLSEIMSEYFSCNSHRKNEIKLKFSNAQKDILEKTVSAFGRNTGELTLRLTTWNPFSNQSNPWFDAEWMFGLEDKFDVVIANPPYGANIDNLIETYRKTYPEVIKNYADIFKIFFDFGLRVLKNNGVETFISPSTYLAQPRYKDLRKYLLNFNIKRIVNLGENVFNEAVVPVCISIIKNSEPGNSYIYNEASLNGKYSGIENLSDLNVSLEKIHSTKDLSLLQKANLKVGEFYADNVLEIKDAGIQYHRSGIGLKNKGGNDLYERLFSNSPDTFSNFKPTWYGKLVNKYSISETTDEYFNLNYKEVLKENESVSFTKEAFNQDLKILWRQTASHVIAVIDSENRLFRNTIQCGWVKEEYKKKLDIYYVLGLFNSNYFRFLYQKIVNETAGRAFPQVKITHLRKLPIRIASEEIQKNLATKVKEILDLKKGNIDTSDLESEIDEQVMDIYNLTDTEKEIVRTF